MSQEVLASFKISSTLSIIFNGDDLCGIMTGLLVITGVHTNVVVVSLVLFSVVAFSVTVGRSTGVITGLIIVLFDVVDGLSVVVIGT